MNKNNIYYIYSEFLLHDIVLQPLSKCNIYNPRMMCIMLGVVMLI